MTLECVRFPKMESASNIGRSVFVLSTRVNEVELRISYRSIRFRHRVVVNDGTVRAGGADSGKTQPNKIGLLGTKGG